jgi:sigma-B regulation protein RsbU (phosphoserine phosphatase)
MAGKLETDIHRVFEASILAKGAFALFEIASGLALAFVGTGTIYHFAARITQHELIRHPADPIAAYVLHAAESLSVDTKTFAALYLLDEDGAALDLAAAAGLPSVAAAEMARITRDAIHPAARCLSEQRPVTVRGVDDRMADVFALKTLARNPALVHLPLQATGAALGVLLLGYGGGAAVPPGETGMGVLEALANQVAIAVYNVRLLRRTESARARRVEELEMLRRSSLAVSSTLDLQESLDRIIGAVQALFPGAEATILEHARDRVGLAAAETTLPILRDGQDSVQNGRAQAEAIAHNAGLRRTVAVPLVSHDQALGLLELHLPGPEGAALRPGEAALLEAIAAQAAVSIENHRFREHEDARQRLERELALASEIQLSLLPGAFPELPGWQFAAIYRAARLVGGDFYDHFVLPGKPARLGLVIADVADKGVPAALYMALSRTIIRTTALSGRGPASALLRANELILKDAAAEMFLTTAYAILELEGGRMIYANAGHNRPVLYRAATGQVSDLPGRGVPLGAFERIHLEERRVDLARGDVLVFYTDGITEAQNPDGAFFEEARLHRVLAEHASNTAEDVAHALDDALRAFQGEAEPADDVACVVVKRT